MPRSKSDRKSEIPFVEGLKVAEVLDVPLEDIALRDMGFQYRLSVSVGDLKSSLAIEGQKEPIDLTGSKPYRIIDGFRRTEAIQALGWKTVKALVHKGITDEEGHKLAFTKNVVRKNLGPMDKANAIFQAKHRGMKPEEVHDFFGLSEKQIKRYEDLLDFPAEIQKLLEKETVPMGHAKVPSDFKVKDKHLDEWVKKIGDGLTAKQLKRELKKTLGGKTGRPKLYLKKEKNGIRVFPFTVGKDSPQAEKEKVIKLFQEAIEVLKG